MKNNHEIHPKFSSSFSNCYRYFWRYFRNFFKSDNNFLPLSFFSMESLYQFFLRNYFKRIVSSPLLSYRFYQQRNPNANKTSYPIFSLYFGRFRKSCCVMVFSEYFEIRVYDCYNIHLIMYIHYQYFIH